MRFSLGPIVIFSNFSCQEVSSIRPKFLPTQLQPGWKQPFRQDVSKSPVQRSLHLVGVKGDSRNHKQNHVEPLVFWAKDRILLQVWFGLQIPGCHSNPQSKGGLFSVICDCSLGWECTQVGPSKQCSLLTTLCLSLWVQGRARQGARQPQALWLQSFLLVSHWCCQIQSGEGVSRRGEAPGRWNELHRGSKGLQPVKMYVDALGRGRLLALPQYFKCSC